MAILHELIVLLEIVNNFDTIKSVYTILFNNKESITTVLLLYDRYLLTKNLKK